MSAPVERNHSVFLPVSPIENDRMPDLKVPCTHVRPHPLSDDRASCVIPFDPDSKGKSVDNVH